MSQGREDATAADGPCGAEQPTVVVARTGRGWSVFAPGRAEDVDDLVEGMTLADLVSEELGATVEPDRGARRAARGAAAGPDPDGDPRDARIAALERTVAQLEHALAARVSTERAIGVLAERQGTTPQAAFEQLRRDARSQGRPVPELARGVLDDLAVRPVPAEADAPARVPPAPRPPVREAGRAPRTRSRAGRGPAEGRS
ncbi:ANTAR domain-containing protein [Geodermatophilus poikilotrophus]|uniref:ANTAR domain-containing protein n=1 Tax=Geodermatophilus poikilotrophus TaxID=1333667 RepID=A0A1I0FPL0_9ACTN|nr:ANTAR domain-containing protein [Geodermatophilus poikilotrophus]SET60289.1 ANTAR domain-containing protein [Geodermatophilus poikilotrophus]